MVQYSLGPLWIRIEVYREFRTPWLVMARFFPTRRIARNLRLARHMRRWKAEPCSSVRSFHRSLHNSANKKSDPGLWLATLVSKSILQIHHVQVYGPTPPHSFDYPCAARRQHLCTYCNTLETFPEPTSSPSACQVLRGCWRS